MPCQLWEKPFLLPLCSLLWLVGVLNAWQIALWMTKQAGCQSSAPDQVCASAAQTYQTLSQTSQWRKCRVLSVLHALTQTWCSKYLIYILSIPFDFWNSPNKVHIIFSFPGEKNEVLKGFLPKVTQLVISWNMKGPHIWVEQGKVTGSRYLIQSESKAHTSYPVAHCHMKYGPRKC